MVCVSIGLKDNIWAMVIPYLFSAWNCIILRTFFNTTIPASLIESAKIDGAGEFRTFFQIVLPLSLPGIATISLFVTLAYWNDWYLPLMLIEKKELYNLQYLLQSLMLQIQQLKQMVDQGATDALQTAVSVPSEGARMALCLVALGPILIVYPFFQKYFVSGLTIGAVKG
jgi:putative aldouronate transport system permease protein